MGATVYRPTHVSLSISPSQANEYILKRHVCVSTSISSYTYVHLKKLFLVAFCLRILMIQAHIFKSLFLFKFACIWGRKWRSRFSFVHIKIMFFHYHSLEASFFFPLNHHITIIKNQWSIFIHVNVFLNILLWVFILMLISHYFNEYNFLVCSN